MFLLSQLPSSGCICSDTLDTSPAIAASTNPILGVNFICVHSVEMALFTVRFNTQISRHKIITPCVDLVKRLKMIKHHNLLTPAHRGEEGTLTIKKCDVF